MIQSQVETIPEVNFPSPETFKQCWEAQNPLDADAAHSNPIRDAGIKAIEELPWRQTAASEFALTDILLRDGQQQQSNALTTDERVKVFDDIVSTGVDRIEIGHLGNENGDQQLARAIIAHIAEHEVKGDDRYDGVELQVLFGSQEGKIQEGIDVLREAFKWQYPDTWEVEMANRIVVHVYDRVDPNLLATASEPYSVQESAYRVSIAAAHAQKAGFKHFSISGEATTAIPAEEAVQYYRAITEQLFENGAGSVNINLPNTYGYSVHENWNVGTMAAFNAGVKLGFEDKVTTSIHPHNDVDNAVSFTMSAIAAGFDRVEGTPFGMGERTGNVALIDVMARIAEQARHQEMREEVENPHMKPARFAYFAGSVAVGRAIKISPKIAENLHNWYGVSQRIAERFGPHALYRWHRTAVGNPYAHDNGSGPHDQAMAAAVIDPLKNPGDSNYEWALITNGILGRDTEAIAMGDPDEVDSITVGNHAGGGKTKAIKEHALTRADGQTIAEAKEKYEQRKQAIIDRMLNGVKIVVG